MRRTQAERSAETRGKLLEATVECVVERGYVGASTTEICRRAGVSRGAQLHHYPTKGELVAAAVEYLFERRHEEFRATLGEGSLELERVLEALWPIYSGPTLAAWMEVVVAARTDPELRQRTARLNREFEEDAAETFRLIFSAFGVPDERVQAATRLVLAVFDGLAMNHVLEPREALAQDVLALFRRLIGPWQDGALEGEA